MPGIGFANNMSIHLVMTLLMGSCSQNKPKKQGTGQALGKAGKSALTSWLRHAFFRQPHPLTYHLKCIGDLPTFEPVHVRN